MSLLSCPFCGGKPSIIKLDDDHTSIQCSRCLCRISTTKGQTLEELISDWNRRTGHTCKIVDMDSFGAPPYRKGDWISNSMSDGCSECGYPFDTLNRGRPNYCANCGAKVVE